MFILVLQKQMLHVMLGFSLMHKAFDMGSHSRVKRSKFMDKRFQPLNLVQFLFYGLKLVMERLISLYVSLCIQNLEVCPKCKQVMAKFFKNMCRKLQQVKEALNHAQKHKLGFQRGVGTLDHLYQLSIDPKSLEIG